MISDSVTLPKVPAGTLGDVKHVLAYLLGLMQFRKCTTLHLKTYAHSVISTQTTQQKFRFLHSEMRQENCDKSCRQDLIRSSIHRRQSNSHTNGRFVFAVSHPEINNLLLRSIYLFTSNIVCSKEHWYGIRPLHCVKCGYNNPPSCL